MSLFNLVDLTKNDDKDRVVKYTISAQKTSCLRSPNSVFKGVLQQRNQHNTRRRWADSTNIQQGVQRQTTQDHLRPLCHQYGEWSMKVHDQYQETNGWDRRQLGFSVWSTPEATTQDGVEVSNEVLLKQRAFKTDNEKHEIHYIKALSDLCPKPKKGEQYRIITEKHQRLCFNLSLKQSALLKCTLQSIELTNLW